MSFSCGFLKKVARVHFYGYSTSSVFFHYVRLSVSFWLCFQLSMFLFPFGLTVSLSVSVFVCLCMPLSVALCLCLSLISMSLTFPDALSISQVFFFFFLPLTVTLHFLSIFYASHFFIAALTDVFVVFPPHETCFLLTLSSRSFSSS